MSIIKEKAGLEDNRLFLFFCSGTLKSITFEISTDYFKSSRS